MSIRNIAIILCSVIIGFSCSSVKKLAVERDISEILKTSPIFSKHHTGFSLYDIEENRFVTNFNASLLFTPASNTKLLTMYACLKSFRDSIPGIIYYQSDSSLLIKPTGDPTLLHDKFSNQPVFDLLREQESIEVIFPESVTTYGSGWAWDDYPYSFQVQRSWWPIYGNVVSITKEDSIISVIPPFFKDFIDIFNDGSAPQSISKEYKYNKFSANILQDTSQFNAKIPFDYSQELFLQLLSDTLNISVNNAETNFTLVDTLFSQPVDTVLARMMKPSDNFLAEQLLIMASWKNGFINVNDYIDYLKTVSLNNLNEMVWVDGSGLSRYNLISPNDQVRLLKKCLEEFGWDRITNILPSGGEGTLLKLYLSDSTFIHAKTGTLSNNHNLSGLLITDSNKRLIFSLMNNHFTVPTENVKKAMQEFLYQIKSAY